MRQCESCADHGKNFQNDDCTADGYLVARCGRFETRHIGRSAPVTRSFTSTADLGEAAVI